VPSLPTAGAFHVDEAYLELNIPLLADAPLAQRLDLSAATRYSDYSTFGDDFTSKLGVRWELNDELLLRATYAEGFRAPSIGELFGSDSRFDATLTDPCSAPVAPDLVDNCAALGVPPGFSQPNPQISVTTGGNPALEAETADSFTAGFVWTPGFARNTTWSERLAVEFTWYRHELDGAIQAIDAQTQLNLCVETLDPTVCEGITRVPSGAISSFSNRLVNLGSIETEGWDADVFWTSPEYAVGPAGRRLAEHLRGQVRGDRRQRHPPAQRTGRGSQRQRHTGVDLDARRDLEVAAVLGLLGHALHRQPDRGLLAVPRLRRVQRRGKCTQPARLGDLPRRAVQLPGRIGDARHLHGWD
jgi:outer membrane receptor protein involved in Fe transport